MDYDQIRETLLKNRELLLERIQKIHGDVHHRQEPYSADFAEQVTETENLEVLHEIEEGSRQELNQINHALERLDNGTYGQCVSCGEPIGEARLKILPYAETCVDCAQS